jgi:capsular exopolysaccharide synthesis family protein
MSRVDEALRRAAATAAGSFDVPETPYPDLDAAAALSAHADEASILERYAIEKPAGLGVIAHPSAVHMAAAPRTDSPVRSLKFHPALEGKLVIGENVSPAAIEQYRRLATMLHDHHVQSGLKTLMVSSSLPEEGKTLTIVNLALTLCNSFRERVLLIDADLRLPSIHAVFGIPNKTGLADSTRAGGGPLPLVEVAPGLSVLTAGRPEASPLAPLASHRAREVVRDAAGQFDWVLLDTPPVGLLPDARLVASLSEGILFVIAAGTTPYTIVKRCIAELGAERIVGVVLNRVEREALDTNGYDGGYYK